MAALRSWTRPIILFCVLILAPPLLAIDQDHPPPPAASGAASRTLVCQPALDASHAQEEEPSSGSGEPDAGGLESTDEKGSDAQTQEGDLDGKPAELPQTGDEPDFTLYLQSNVTPV